jgi:hypothetical protein
VTPRDVINARDAKNEWSAATGIRCSSLRWHDPDQVRRSELGEAPSQPGITGLPCFL